MAVHSRWDLSHLVHYDTHLKRIIDVQGPDVVKYKLTAQELKATASDPDNWTTTVVEGGAGNSEFDVADEIDFIGKLVTDNFDNDGINVQLLGEQFKFDSSHHSYFGIRFKINDVTQSDFLLGFAVTDVTLLAAVADAVYFESLDGSTSIDFVAEKGNSETTELAVGTLVDDALIYLEFYWDGLKLEAFVDGVSVYYATPANLPDTEELRLSMHFLTGETSVQTFLIADLRAYQWGRA